MLKRRLAMTCPLRCKPGKDDAVSYSIGGWRRPRSDTPQVFFRFQVEGGGGGEPQSYSPPGRVDRVDPFDGVVAGRAHRPAMQQRHTRGVWMGSKNPSLCVGNADFGLPSTEGIPSHVYFCNHRASIVASAHCDRSARRRRGAVGRRCLGGDRCLERRSRRSSSNGARYPSCSRRACSGRDATNRRDRRARCQSGAREPGAGRGRADTDFLSARGMQDPRSLHADGRQRGAC